MDNMEPNGGNLYKPHTLQIDSGTFWRCKHGLTGYKEGLKWVGCMDCKAEFSAETQKEQTRETLEGRMP